MNLLVGDVAIIDGLIAESAAPDAEVIDATGLIVAPGLIDLQVNGAIGIDVTDSPEQLWEIAAALPRWGVTAWLPTVITSSPEARSRALAALDAGRPAGVAAGAVPLGLHFEGPFLDPDHRGAHPPQWLREPSLELIEGWSREAGVVMVTIAPELTGSAEVIAELVRRGVVVSVGHTAAVDISEAVDAGATTLTHLFNAMPGLHHRVPGPVGTAFDDPRLTCGVIVDGHHLDPAVVRIIWRQLGPSRFMTVTDTTAGLGLPNGVNRLGDQEVVIADGAVRLADGTLAGSAASLDGCLRLLRSSTGASAADVLATATSTPARLLGDVSRGTLEVGSRGDLTLLTPDLEVVATIIAGEVVFDSRTEEA